MSLKSCFEKAARAIGQFIDRQEIRQLEATKGMAKAGYLVVAGGRTSLITKIGPAEAERMIKISDRRIAAIRQKNGWTVSP